jgi:hypothetical protein
VLRPRRPHVNHAGLNISKCVGAGLKPAPHQAIEAGGAVVGDKIKITLHVEAIRQA